MAVGWKNKKSDKKRDMTQMELAREERKQRENRERARAETERKATEMLKRGAVRLVRPKLGDFGFDEDGQKYSIAVRRWEYECKAVVRLAVQAQRESCHKIKYVWNGDWGTTGELLLAKKAQEA